MVDASLQAPEAANSTTPMILVINKIDCAPSLSMEQFYIDNSIFRMHVQTCAVTGTGIKELEKAVLEIRELEYVPAGGRRWTVKKGTSQLPCNPSRLVFS